MTAERGFRIGLTGATGAVGTEVLTVLDTSSLRVAELVAVAGEASLGSEIDFQGTLVPVQTELPELRGLDLLINCAPREATPEITRKSLHAEVPCIDVSGEYAGRPEVTLGWPPDPGIVAGAEPLLACPVGVASVWLPVLDALAGLGAPRRITATVLDAASAAGREGIDALSVQSMALFNSQDIPEETGDRHLAFDCLPGAVGEGTAREEELARVLGRARGEAPALTVQWVDVPVFVGQTSNLVIGFDAPVAAGEAREALAKAPGLELWEQGGEPNLRAASGRDVVIVGSPETAPADATALRFWVAADPLRLAATHAVRLAAARLLAPSS